MASGLEIHPAAFSHQIAQHPRGKRLLLMSSGQMQDYHPSRGSSSPHTRTGVSPNDNADDVRKHKRKRQTVSHASKDIRSTLLILPALLPRMVGHYMGKELTPNSKRRKTKCDKSSPCGMCLARGEPTLCGYDDRLDGVPQSSESDDLRALKSRVEELERLMAPHHDDLSVLRTRLDGLERVVTPFVPSLPSHKCAIPAPGPPGTRTEDIESAASALEAMATGCPQGVGSVLNPPASMQGLSELSTPSVQAWPSILDFAASTARRQSARWVREMEAIIEAIPAEDVVTSLVNRFFSDSQRLSEFDAPLGPWLTIRAGHCLYEQSFRVELAQLFPALRSGNHLLIDPAWLGLLIAILQCAPSPWSSLTRSTACQDIGERPGDDIASLGYTPASFRDLSALLIDTFESALVAAKFLAKPQMRLLSAILTVLPTV